jgi:hypothetical protein
LQAQNDFAPPSHLGNAVFVCQGMRKQGYRHDNQQGVVIIAINTQGVESSSLLHSNQ